MAQNAASGGVRKLKAVSARERLVHKMVDTKGNSPEYSQVVKGMPAKKATWMIAGGLLEGIRSVSESMETERVGGSRKTQYELGGMQVTEATWKLANALQLESAKSAGGARYSPGGMLEVITLSKAERIIAYLVWDLLMVEEPLKAKEIGEMAGLEENKLKRIAARAARKINMECYNEGEVKDRCALRGRGGPVVPFNEGPINFDDDDATALLSLFGENRESSEEARASASRGKMEGITLVAKRWVEEIEIVFSLNPKAREKFETRMKQQLASTASRGEAAVRRFNHSAGQLKELPKEKLGFCLSESFGWITKHKLHESRKGEIREAMELTLSAISGAEAVVQKRALEESYDGGFSAFLGEVLVGMIDNLHRESCAIAGKSAKEKQEQDLENEGGKLGEIAWKMENLAKLEEARLRIASGETGGTGIQKCWAKVYEAWVPAGKDIDSIGMDAQGRAAYAALYAGMESEKGKAVDAYLANCKKYKDWRKGTEFAARFGRKKESEEITELGLEEHISRGDLGAAMELAAFAFEEKNHMRIAIKEVTNALEKARRIIGITWE